MDVFWNYGRYLMARTLQQIKKDMEKLEREAERIKEGEMAGVIERVKVAIEFYGLTVSDLFGARAKAGKGKAATGKRAGQKSASTAKYIDSDTKRTWTGHGKRPMWFVQAIERGVKPEEMAV